MLRLTTSIAALLSALTLASPALGNTSGSLRTSTGGTGLSTGHGSGGTGLSSRGSAAGSIRGLSSSTPSRASTPASGSQQQMTPAKPHATPPAGVRPHTDLAAASKLIALSSAGLTKRSQLFPQAALPPGDPRLVGPSLNKIGASEGGAGSFRALYSIRADLGGGSIYPNHQAGATGRSLATLSGSSELRLEEAPAEAEARGRSSGRGLLYWLQCLLTAAATGVIGWWMWNARPKDATLAAAPATGLMRTR